MCWITLVRRALSGRAGPRAALAAALTWALPFALGPPLFSRDAYAYAAQGELARRGLDPATHGVAALAAGGPAPGTGSPHPAGTLGAAFSDAVDPRWRDTHTPYGGGAVAVERFAATVGHLLGGGPTTALVTLRVVAVVAVVVMVACAVRLVGRLPRTAGPAGEGRRQGHRDGAGDGALARAVVLALVAANPVTVIHLVGGMHLDALAAAALAGALLIDRRRAGDDVPIERPAGGPGVEPSGGPFGGNARRVVSGAAVAATALACFAGMIKVTALLGLAWLVVAHARDAMRLAPASDAPRPTAPGPAASEPPAVGPGSRAAAGNRWWLAAAAVAVDLAVAAAVLGLSVLASGFPPTWIKALATSGELTTGIAPASLLATLVAAGAGLVGWRVPAGRDSALLTDCRAVTLAAAAAVVAVLLWRAWRRPRTSAATAGDRDGLAVLGIGGFAVAIGSPVLYPWYLGPALPMLAVLIADEHVRTRDAAGPARRRCRAGVAVVCFTSVLLCGATLSPLAQTWRLLGPHGPAFPAPLVVTLAVAAALVTATGAVATRRAHHRAAPD
ncbi:polyprenol phosphomannose-dependent alpha 1,6 mannosyltransferase MptB [Pseudofrankia saprophytica]|uniref:polyprenol phosphomannose-dependent alpha 1,6 mannosyltransferase MptB n=1 Tax=Pseudofrankia saprophytica TaxID=298655 RepID=UPI0006864CC7|nr:polyprenol phosphomannose-dependent alpha 1,6 mannosyltransferase MptB [Pseudofrankia saprophytica]